MINKRAVAFPGALTYPKVLTPEEQFALLRTLNRRWPTKLRNYAMVLTMLRTGLRVGEAVALKWEHLDFRTRRLIVTAYCRGQRRTAAEEGRWRDSAAPVFKTDSSRPCKSL